MKYQCIIFVVCLAWCSAEFSDGMQEFDSECMGEDKFPCMGGGCISQEQYCDGFVDCDDGSDENFCAEHHPDEFYCKQTHQFMCQDTKKCIPMTWLCNNDTDCDDGSDEANCTALPPIKDNSTCKGFQCDGNKCISMLWVCDGVYDCDDKSDEYDRDLCRQVSLPHAILDGSFCQELPSLGERNYKCLDQSYCLPASMMCDGIQDCRDGTDEGVFCKNWDTMCNNFTCSGNGTECSPERYGPSCLCRPALSMRQYNYITKQCDDVNECLMERPQCSHKCVNADGHFLCECDPGYRKDDYEYLCYAYDPEAMLFFSTRSEIKYLKMKSKQMVTVATGIKQAHGVTFDGTYIYWVETAQGHQSIFKAQLDDIQDTKQVLVGLGLEDPGDIAIDYLGGNIYFSDAERGIISACRADGSICTTIHTDTQHPRFVTLDAKNGKMYWSDWHRRAVIMTARMDGSHPDVLVDHLDVYATGLALDAPNERLYFVDKTVKVAMVNGKHIYSLFQEPFHHPYSIVVFENTVFWSDWMSNSIQTLDKLHGIGQKRNVLLKLDTPVIGMHIYHPVLMNATINPCSNNNCSHLCLISSNVSHVCACPDGMEIDNNECHHVGDYRPKYLVVAGGHTFTKIQYDALGNPECHATHFDIGRVQAMAYDQFRDSLFLYDGQRKTVSYINMTDFALGITHPLIYNGMDNVVDMDYDYATDNLYMLDAGRRLVEVVSLRTQKRAVVHRFEDQEVPISLCVMPDYGVTIWGQPLDSLFLYDGQRKTVSYINMTDFALGITHPLIYNGMDNVVDMDYDYATDNLYMLDAGRRLVEVVSLRTQKRAVVHRFEDQEVPISLCVMPDYGRMMVAVVESEMHNSIHIDSIGLDGEGRRHVIMNNLKGPHVRLRYVQHMDQVYISDESNGIIDYIHPEGTGRENYRELSTTVTSLAIADNYVFWTDRRTSRLFWSDIHQTSHKIRRIDLAFFPNNTQLLIQATTGIPDSKDPLMDHPCLKSPCSDVCVQEAHVTPGENPIHFQMSYKCLCPPGLLVKDSQCTKVAVCGVDEILCHRSNICVPKSGRCDGKLDCPKAEDEEGCIVVPNICSSEEIFCNGLCINKNKASSCSPTEKPASAICSDSMFQCPNSSICLPRLQLCDGRNDCPDGADEKASECDTHTCLDEDFMCATGSCVPKTWNCDGDVDCSDGSDEVNCANTTCRPGFYQCRNRECIEVRKRCDHRQDCLDFSDEEDCEEEPEIVYKDIAPRCSPREYTCELNTSICLPHTARCNLRIDCPGGTDEHGCEYQCGPRGMFPCKQQINVCIAMRKVCNGKEDCHDGSDETYDACVTANKTSPLYPLIHPVAECEDGYICRNGQCIEWKQVCDKRNDCADGTDEKGICETACSNSNCSVMCQPTPVGPHCLCRFGYRLAADNISCEDIDECTQEVCSQGCINVPGSFLCTCHHGYALRRSDRRSCKATRGNMSVLYVSGNTVRSISADGYGAVEYTDTDAPAITDMDYNVREKKLYVTSAEAGKLIEVNNTQDAIIVTNIGKPTRVAVDWVTANVYFVDTTTNNSRIRVCHVVRRRCASLQKLPSDAKITALVVDPSSARMFYCVTRNQESVVWSATLAGRQMTDLTTVHNCTGLAVDSFKRKLYVAETGPAHIIRMDYEGESHTKILAEDPQLEAPHGLAIFEDYIYYLVANSYRLSRCLMFGPKHCETYIYRVFEANTFVIRHESVQRDDLVNLCEGITCDNVCALEEDGPKCLCEDGSLMKDGVCPAMDKKDRPLFNGWSNEELATAHSVSFTIIMGVLALAALYIGVFVYYHFVYLPRKKLREATYTEVRFQNSTTDDEPFPADPTVQMNTASGPSHEFVNPLQFARNVWYGSFLRKPTQPNPNDELPLTIPESPPQQDLSDTESDLDDKEHQRIIKM